MHQEAPVSQVAQDKVRQVLIADSDPLTAEVLRASLQHAGFRVLTAAPPKELLDVDVLGQHSPDLILLGVPEAEMSGIGLLGELWQAKPTRSIPVLLLVGDADEERIHSVLGGSFDYITKPFDPGKVVAYVKSYFPDLPYTMDANLLTQLPGLRWVEHEIVARLSQGKSFALMNVDINWLRPFRSVYGVPKADHAIRLLGRIVTEAVRLLGNDDDFVGHVSEDDFYVITSPNRVSALCPRIISKFDDGIRDLYKREDVVRGYLECEYPAGCVRQQPIMTLAIGVTTTENRGAMDPLAMRRIATEMRELARSDQHSSFRFDQRGNDLRLEGALAGAGRQNGLSSYGRKTSQAQREKTDFSQFVANQLRIPVTIVQSTLDYLAQSGQMNLTVEQRQHLEVIRKHTRHLSDIISQLTTFPKIHRRDYQTHLGNVDLATTLNQIAASAREIAVGKGVDIEVSGGENISRIVVDERKMAEVVLYTLYAVVEYAPRNPKIRINVSETDSHVRMALTVNELSLTRDELAKAFRSFYRPQKMIVANHGSVGLALHLAKALMSSIGGGMSVRRRDGVTINLDFPKVWQGVVERTRLIQKNLQAAKSLAKTEMDQVHALLASRDDVHPSVQVIFGSIEALAEQLALEGNRAIALVEETSNHLIKERERAASLDASFMSFLEVVIDLLERRDRCFAGHSRRVAVEALDMGRVLKLSEDELSVLYYAGLLHDVGLITISDEILRHAGELSRDEVLILQQHPIIGGRALAAAKIFDSLVNPILHHHERVDGRGYPTGLKGEKIPLAARILAVAEAYDSMISAQAHRLPISDRLAKEKIIEGAGTQFDPKVVAAFLKLHTVEDPSGILN